MTRGRRWKVFVGVLLLATAIGLTIVYARSPVYRASASVLTVQPRAIDRISQKADIQHNSIQGRLLLGEQLLGQLAAQLQSAGQPTTVDQLQQVLSVKSVSRTNLLELRAKGNDPQQLQELVNAWARSYENYRAEEIEALTRRTTAEVKDQARELENKIAAARDELQAFRQANRIVGLERGENTALASLKGLNNSLNKARDKLIGAQARQAAIRQANARGETVVPEQQKATVTKLRLKVGELRRKLKNLKKRYTEVYISVDPNLKELPQELRKKEQALDQALHIAHVAATEQATQTVQSAQLSIVAIEKKLEQQRGRVELFNERYKEFQMLEENLRRLEGLLADNAQRLAEIEVKNLKKFPPIKVVQWAELPTTPIYPDYERDLMIALGIAFGLALFSTWLVEYLGEKNTPQPAPQFGVHIHTGEQSQPLPPVASEPQLTQAAPAAPLEAPPPRLPSLPRELSGAEVQALLGASGPLTGGYITLLLSGVSPFELSTLHAGSFDPTAHRIELGGSEPRGFEFPPSAWRRIVPLLDELANAQGKMHLAELDRGLLAAAQHSRLDDGGNINALALWHTYVLHLVRQGIDSNTLTERVGTIPPDVLDQLMQHAPPGGTPAGIDFTYPALAY